MKKLIPQSLKNIYHLIVAIIASYWFDFPSKKIKVIGVTGTNGKTTTVQMISKILQDAGHKIAVSSTINFKIGQKEWVNKTKFTTVSAWEVQKFILDALRGGCEYLVLEVSSHSLDQNRVWGIEYDVAVITNVTREHLDYHKTMEKYRVAKLKLFERIKKGGTAVVNLGMENPEDFLRSWEGGKLAYAVDGPENKLQTKKDLKISNTKLGVVFAKDLKTIQDGSNFSINGTQFHLKLPGKFNVENALAAVCVGLSQDVAIEKISESIGQITKVPGRMDHVDNKFGIDIIIDYALTPDSMEQLGRFVDQAKTEDQKIIWVFGSCGQRDRGKRPIMGRIVSVYADLAIVTNEDPYHEDPQAIIEEVFAGVIEGGKKENDNAWRIFDRKEAIKKALEEARKGDIVLITGKGAEETMAIGDKRIPWNDRTVVEELLEKK